MDFPLGPAAQLLAILAAQLVTLLLAHLLAQLLWQLHTSVPGMGRFLVRVPNPLALGSEAGNLSRGFLVPPCPVKMVKAVGQNKGDALESFQFQKAIMNQHKNNEQ